MVFVTLQNRYLRRTVAQALVKHLLALKVEEKTKAAFPGDTQ